MPEQKSTETREDAGVAVARRPIIFLTGVSTAMKNKFISSIFDSVASLAGAKLGRCVFCMRKSFTAALIAWVAILGAVQFPVLRVNSGLVGISMAVALTLTLLWLSHLVAAASRSTGSTLSEEALSGYQLSRRNSLLLLAKSFAVAAIWSAMPHSMLASNMESRSAGYSTGSTNDHSQKKQCMYQCQRQAAQCEMGCINNFQCFQQCLIQQQQCYNQCLGG